MNCLRAVHNQVQQPVKGQIGHHVKMFLLLTFRLIKDFRLVRFSVSDVKTNSFVLA